MDNQQIAKILYNISIYLEMNDDFFRARAYNNAARTIETLDMELKDVYKQNGIDGLDSIEGIGIGIAKKIEELLKTSHLKYYEELKKKIPVDIEELTRIEGIGPKKIKVLYRKLKIKNIKGLEKAAKSGKIRKLEGFGEKTEENILKGIEFLKKSHGRFLLGDIFSLVNDIEQRLEKQQCVDRAIVAGSFRRRKETIGDADILVVSKEPEKVMNYFTKMPEVARVYGKGSTKSMIILKNGLDVDLRVVPAKSYGAALNYFTGNKDHNVRLRQIAKMKGMKLSEYGLFRGSRMIAGKTEEDVYTALGLRYIEPEMRENKGELFLSEKNKLPDLIGYDDIKGDLQVQTNWTDGANSIKEMALAAKREGFEYILITDHTKSLAMTGGLDEKKLEKQRKEIDRINKEVKGIKIFQGAEVNIMKDGSLDINDKELKKLDLVGIAVHSNFNMSEKEMTSRIRKAMENEHADIFFHPTGRIIKKREPYAVDIDEIIDAAKSLDKILEIDAFPNRLDLKDDHIRKAVQKKVKLSIDTDAHHVSHFSFMKFGIAQARRGWATKNDVINTMPLKKIEKFIEKRK
jgi:DNA polymerase (family 10)